MHVYIRHWVAYVAYFLPPSLVSLFLLLAIIAPKKDIQIAIMITRTNTPPTTGNIVCSLVCWVEIVECISVLGFLCCKNSLGQYHF